MRRPVYSQEKNPGTYDQEAGWDLQPGEEKKSLALARN